MESSLKQTDETKVELFLKQLNEATERVKAIENSIASKLFALDKQIKKTFPPKRHAELDVIESKLNDVFEHQREYFDSARPCYAELLRIPLTDANQEQLIRVYKKFTWLHVYPRDYNDGLWAQFSREDARERDRSPTRK